jgi:hypothetical protein
MEFRLWQSANLCSLQTHESLVLVYTPISYAQISILSSFADGLSIESYSTHKRSVFNTVSKTQILVAVIITLIFSTFNMSSSIKNCPSLRCASADNVCRYVDTLKILFRKHIVHSVKEHILGIISSFIENKNNLYWHRSRHIQFTIY